MHNLKKNNEPMESAESNAAVRVKNLKKAYKLYPSGNYRLKEALHPFRKKYHQDFYALKNVSFEVKKGEVLGIVGKNGSGKSTLLKIISGVLQPTAGEVHTQGNISALLELGSGFNPEYTGIDNIYFYGSIMGFTKEEMDDRREEILSFADIGDFIHQPLKKYSSGMVARLAFAAAINIDPEILIVDEVLAVGDELFRRKCYAKIEQFMDEGITILFVAHSTATINELCTHAILLDQGDLILEGPSKLVTAQYERFLNARKEKISDVRNEILAMKIDDRVKARKKEESVKINTKRKRMGVESYQKNQKENLSDTLDRKPSFIKGFETKSRVEYKNYDVSVFDIHIRTPGGKNVNSLLMEEEYIYSYKISFNIDAENVAFGMKFKTEKSINLSGVSSHKLNKKIRKVSVGDIYSVDWRFKCFLLPGIYYTNLGVSAQLGKERVFLNRIVDAIVFKVQAVPNLSYSGLILLNQDVEINRVQ